MGDVLDYPWRPISRSRKDAVAEILAASPLFAPKHSVLTPEEAEAKRATAAAQLMVHDKFWEIDTSPEAMRKRLNLGPGYSVGDPDSDPA